MYSTLFTNDKRQSGKFIKEFEKSIKIYDNLIIATGYFGTVTIEDLESKIVNLSKRGSCKILIGMIFYGGVTLKQKNALENIDKKLRAVNKSNGIYISMEPYHGKIYKFYKDEDKKVYLGSSNFSKEGFSSRLEATSLLVDDTLITEVSNYLDYLFSLESTVALEEVELKVNKSKRGKTTLPSKDLEDYLIDCSEFPSESSIIGICDIKLRVDKQPRSSLNLYFDKGRIHKGKYTPRPWYEVEITSTVDDRKNKFYPESTLTGTSENARNGSFTAFIKYDEKCYRIKMKVSADFGKNIASADESGGRGTLGRIIKGRLESAGVLKEGELITSDILDAYGNDTLKLKKIDSTTYIMEF